jgi:hypothetical protein
MGRTRKQSSAPTEDNFDPVKLEEADQAARQLGRMQDQAAKAAQAVALQVGYDGTLTVGALEDEIRFYQRRTVEAILETGKRLLVLKELTPHGEFEKRVELLGFHIRTAQRFMSTAVKTAKSEKLSLLSTQVKSASTFLELVTHDDDTLEEFSQFDDIDKMSASEARAALREIRADKDAQAKVLDETQKKLTELRVQKKRIKTLDPDAELIELTKEAQSYVTEAVGMIRGRVRAALEHLQSHCAENGAEPMLTAMAGMVGQLQTEIAMLREQFSLGDVSGVAENPDAEVWAEIRTHLAKQSNGDTEG